MLRLPLATALLIGIAGCPSSDAPTPEAAPIETPHDAAIQAAWAWLDAVEVDPVALIERGVQGKKKLGEILGVYLYLQRYSTDANEQPRLQRRIRELAAQAARPEYHNMLECELREFNANRMSYLRVAWLLDLLGQDTHAYRHQLDEMRPRLEAELAARPPTQPARIAAYYDYFGWEKPEPLRASRGSILDRRLPPASYQPMGGYALAHEVSAAFRYGTRRTQDSLDRDDLAYLRRVLPSLVMWFTARKSIDLVAELISSMTYLELHALPAYGSGISFLLASQNADGSWGEYDQHRSTYGEGVDQKFYLHTTMVTLRALLEARDGAWLKSDEASGAGHGQPLSPGSGSGAVRESGSPATQRTSGPGST